MRYVLALDQGTTSSRSILFDEQANIVATAQQEFPQIFPHSGWVEHDPEAIWQSQLHTLRSVLHKAGVSAAQVASIGITNQRETTVVWDRQTGYPIYNAIVWQDQRTADHCEQLRQAGHEALFRERTGLVLDPYFSGTKLAWLLDHVPGARAQAQAGKLAFGTIDSWLAWRLSGGRSHVTDVSNASRTLMFDIHRGCWDDDLLALLNIPRGMLPEVRPSCAPMGVLDTSWLGTSVPIGGMAGDQQAALFGQGCHQPGMAKNTYGTGCFMLLQTGPEVRTSTHGLLTTAAAQFGDQPHYALEGSVFMGGAVVQWLRDGLGIIEHAAEIESLANSVPDSGGVYLVPAFTGLGAPHWDPHARGGLLGLSRGTNRAHIARAALEAIAFQSAELLLAMQADASHPVTELRVDGGAAANATLLQFQADLLGIPVLRPKVLETTALGAAYLAGLQAGVWQGLDELQSQWQLDHRFEPCMSRDEAQHRLDGWLKAVGRVGAWAT